MKKILLIPMALALVFTLFACKPDTRLRMDADTEVTTTVAIVYDDLETMIDSGRTFALLIRSNLCSSCDKFEPILDQVIADYQIRVYQITQEEGFPPGNPLIPFSSTPTFVIVRDGEVWEAIDPITHDQAFESADDFAEYIDNFIVLEKK